MMTQTLKRLAFHFFSLIMLALASLSTFDVQKAFAYSPATDRVVVVLFFKEPIDWIHVLQPLDVTWQQIRRDRVYQQASGLIGDAPQDGYLTRQWHQHAQKMRGFFERSNGSAFGMGLWTKIGFASPQRSRERSIRMWASGVNRIDHPLYGSGWAARLADVNSSVFSSPIYAWDLSRGGEAYRGGGFVPARVHDWGDQVHLFENYGESERILRTTTLFSMQELYGFSGEHASRLASESIPATTVQADATLAGAPGTGYSGYSFGEHLSAAETIIKNFSQTNLILGEVGEFDSNIDQRNVYNKSDGVLSSLDSDVQLFLDRMEVANLQENVVLILASDAGRAYGATGFVDTSDSAVTRLRGTPVIGGPGDIAVFATQVRSGFNGPGYTVDELRGSDFSAPNGTHAEFLYAVVSEILGYDAAQVIDVDGGNPGQFDLLE